jgi:hemerythrin-like domain-containing protein
MIEPPPGKTKEALSAQGAATTTFQTTMTFQTERSALHPLLSLTRDHVLLTQLTDALEAYVAAMLCGRPLYPGDFSALVEGLRSFADLCHFEKEEQVLVPALVQNGFRYGAGLLAETEETDAQLRHLARVLFQSSAREPHWNDHERRTIAAVAREFCAAQQRLGARQEIELFPEILTRLRPEVLSAVAARLQTFDERSEAWAPRLELRRTSEVVLSRYAPEPEVRLAKGQVPERAPVQARTPKAQAHLAPGREPSTPLT